MNEAQKYYQKGEQWLLKNKIWLNVALLFIIGVSIFFFYSVNVQKKFLIPAAAWVVYMLNP